jgi:hypothetical protein
MVYGSQQLIASVMRRGYFPLRLLLSSGAGGAGRTQGTCERPGQTKNIRATKNHAALHGIG